MGGSYKGTGDFCFFVRILSLPLCSHFSGIHILLVSLSPSFTHSPIVLLFSRSLSLSFSLSSLSPFSLLLSCCFLSPDYSCALQKDILLQGRLYLSENWLCFYSNIFGWETTVSPTNRDAHTLTLANAHTHSHSHTDTHTHTHTHTGTRLTSDSHTHSGERLTAGCVRPESMLIKDFNVVDVRQQTLSFFWIGDNMQPLPLCVTLMKAPCPT